MKTGILVCCFLALALGTRVDAADCIKNSDGNVVCGKGQCEMDQYGAVSCAKEGGGAIKDEYGNVKCGVGHCAKDDRGRIRCSTRPGGGAAMDSNGQVKCLGGCRDATQQLCEKPR